MSPYGASTALLVVDVQNDFADPAGSLYVATGEQVVPLINAEIARARAGDSPVFYTQDWHPAATPHFEKDGGIWPVHCVQGTWGAAFHPDLVVAGPVIRKGSNGEDGYSGFSMRDPVTGVTVSTGLSEALLEADITRIVVCGLATDYCVKSTALDARAIGLPTTVLRGAIRAVDVTPGDGDRAMKEMLDAGVSLDD